MFRDSGLMKRILLLCLFTTSLVTMNAWASSAAAENSGEALVRLLMRDVEEQQLRTDAKNALVGQIASEVANLGGLVIQRRQVADHLPDEMVQAMVDDTQVRLAGVYTQHLGPSEVTRVLNYLESDIGSMVLALLHAEADLSGLKGRTGYTTITQLVSFERSVLEATLTADELRAFAELKSSPALQKIADDTLEIGFEAAGILFAAPLRARRTPVDVDEAVFCQLLRDETTVSFPNRLHRREALASLGSC